MLPAQKPDVLVETGSTGRSVSSVIAASGTTVYVACATVSGFRSDIYCNRSRDGGATWLPAAVRLDTGTAPGAADSLGPDIAAAGDLVAVAWQDFRNNANRPDIYSNRSADGGATWLPAPVRLNVGVAPGTSSAFHPRIAVVGSAVHVVWEDYRYGNGDILYNRSLDGGLTWLPVDVRLDVGALPGTSESVEPRLAAVGSSVWVLWEDRRHHADNGDIYFNRSSDGGTTWLAADVRLDTGSAPGAASSSSPRLAASGTGVHAAWADTRNGNHDIYYNGSQDGGATWLPTAVRLDTGSGAGVVASLQPAIAAAGANVHVAWEDLRSSGPNYNADIFANHSADGGTTWLPQDVRVDHGTGNATQVALAAAGDSLYVAWHDHRHSGPSLDRADIYWNRSLDQGSTWLPFDVRLNVHTPPGTAGVRRPLIAASASSAYIVWDNDGPIYFALATGFQPYGVGTGGSNGLVPSLSGSGNAAVGGSYSLDFGNGLGGAPALIVYAIGPASIVSQPLLGGTLLVSPMVTMFILLGGAPGVPGAGGASIPRTVPSATSLLGVDLNSQGLFLDSGAVGGVSMSSGLQIWIG